MGVSINGKYYYVGEYPPALTCRYLDENNVLDTSIANATLTALVLIDSETGSERSVSCTNNDDGTFTIDWETTLTNDSDFPSSGMMRVDVKVEPSGGAGRWYMDRFSIPVKDRT